MFRSIRFEDPSKFSSASAMGASGGKTDFIEMFGSLAADLNESRSWGSGEASAVRKQL